MGACKAWVNFGLRLFVWSLFCLGVIPVPASAASLVVSLSSPQDLSQLHIGQSFPIEVSLAGLQPGEQLVSLTAGVSLDPSLVSPPSGLAAGLIVPSPPHLPSDFQTTATADEADAAFTTSSRTVTENIASNGVFYRFDLVATSPGSGQIAINPLALAAEQVDPANPNSLLLRPIDAGPPLSLTILAPEPSGLLGLVLAGACWGRSRTRPARAA